MSAFPHAAGWHPRFRSKIDVWLGGVMVFGILGSAAVAIGFLLQKGMASLAVIPLLATGVQLWVLMDTWYAVSETDLIVHCGPFRAVVPIASIQAMRPTRTLVSGPALSLDRLEVIHVGGRLVISPADKVGFIRALRERHPSMEKAPVEAPSSSAAGNLRGKYVRGFARPEGLHARERQRRSHEFPRAVDETPGTDPPH